MADKYENALRSYRDKVNENYSIDADKFSELNVKRGLRNKDGSGVLAGLTDIGSVHGYVMDEGEKRPDDGILLYRGYNINDLVNACERENRFGYEEVAYLLLVGELPNREELEAFKDLLEVYRTLPNGFTEDVILKAPGKDIMNKLASSVLVSYSYDRMPDDTSLKNTLRQCIKLIARLPVMIAYSYHAKLHFYDHKSLCLHIAQKGMSSAETFLHLIRNDSVFTDEEARLLDLCMILHAEHGGGNNSTFTTRVLTSSGTDTFSTMSAAIGSLKGPKHGGANIKVVEMMDVIKAGVQNWSNVDEVCSFLERIVRKEEYDKSGLIYGMGHAVYTKSDPRAVLLKKQARSLAEKAGRVDELNLYELIEAKAPEVFSVVKNSEKCISANVDFYSGFVYSLLGLPAELYTPIFAMSRIAGWSAHRIEELSGPQRIIRPAYKSVSKKAAYIDLNDRV